MIGLPLIEALAEELVTELLASLLVLFVQQFFGFRVGGAQIFPIDVLIQKHHANSAVLTGAPAKLLVVVIIVGPIIHFCWAVNLVKDQTLNSQHRIQETSLSQLHIEKLPARGRVFSVVSICGGGGGS